MRLMWIMKFVPSIFPAVICINKIDFPHWESSLGSGAKAEIIVHIVVIVSELQILMYYIQTKWDVTGFLYQQTESLAINIVPLIVTSVSLLSRLSRIDTKEMFTFQISHVGLMMNLWGLQWTEQQILTPHTSRYWTTPNTSLLLYYLFNI